jgi:hypothetical protein
LWNTYAPRVRLQKRIHPSNELSIERENRPEGETGDKVWMAFS